MRVGLVTVKAGETEGLHIHPYPRVLVCLDGATIQVRRQDGTIETTIYQPGHVRYQTNKDPHEPMNVGQTDFRGAIIEFKESLAPPPSKPDPLDPVAVAGKFHGVVLENERVRVLEVRVKPGELEPMHKHMTSAMIILNGGTARFRLPNGSSKQASFSARPKAGEPPQVFWEEAETHSVENVGKTPIRLIRVEIK